MTAAVVLFTSDLRLHDHPPLHAALNSADEVVPLFVRDPAVHAAGFDVPNRAAFLADCLADLDSALRRCGGRLVVRTGPVAREVRAVAAACGATEVHMAASVTGYNRTRLLVASFLAKTLYVDWRIGARHFLRYLVDGDLVNNQLNWQWVAGTGTRPHRVLNPVLQGKRYDPDGTYVRRWVPELADVGGTAVHEPWRLPADERARLRHPAPLLDLGEGLARLRQARGRG
ncbi:FAD-binding domain-containing protein [Streptomyces sp. NPDC003007]